MRFIGIDPGTYGGIAILNEKGGIDVIDVMQLDAGRELDEKWLVNFLKINNLVGKSDHMVFLEKGQAMSGNGVCSVYTYGEHNGSLKTILRLLKIPYELIAPQIWTRIMHVGCTEGKAKDKSRQAIKRLFPEADLRDPYKPKSIKVHEGIMDALLIAEYGRRKWVKTCS